MSLLVKDYIQKRGKSGDVGLELEVEAKNSLPTLANDLWVTKREGSLRGIAAEYVSPRPLSLVQASNAISNVIRELSKTQYEVIKDSPRTSFHVHLNAMYMTPTQYWTVVTAYWLVENLLFKYCAPSRKGNHFCLRLSDAEGALKYALDDLRAKVPFYALRADSIRYAGLNLAATLRFGSLEFRGMDGHLDTGRFNTWTQEIGGLGSKVFSYKNPQALLEAYFSMDKKDFLNTLFSPDFVNVLTGYKDWQGLMEDNEGSLCELAYFHDWSKWEDRVSKEMEGLKKSGALPSLQDEIPYDTPPPIIPTNEEIFRARARRNFIDFSSTTLNVTTGSTFSTGVNSGP